MANPKKILVAEDEQGIADLIKTVLEGEGFKVSFCASGDKLLKNIKRGRPSLVISDLWLPGMDGTELTRLIKSHRSTKSIPVVIISAQEKLEHISKDIKADGFLSKPFKLEDLIRIVKKFAK